MICGPHFCSDNMSINFEGVRGETDFEWNQKEKVYFAYHSGMIGCNNQPYIPL